MKENYSESSESLNLDKFISFKEVLELLNHRKWVILSFSIIAVAFVLSLHLLAPSFSARSYLVTESEKENTGFHAILGTLGNNLEAGNPYNESDAEKMILLLKTPDFYASLADELEIQSGYTSVKDELRRHDGGLLSFGSSSDDKLTRKKMAKYLSRNIRLASKGGGLIEVQVNGPSKEAVVFVTNTYLDHAVRTLSDKEGAKLKKATDYLNRKIEEVVKKMERTDQQIIGVNTKNAPVSLLAPQDAVGESLLKLKAEINSAKIAYDQNEKVLENLRARVKSTEVAGTVATPVNDDVIFGINRTIANLESQNQLLKLKISSMEKGLKELLQANLSLPKQEQALADLRRQKGLEYFVFDNLVKTHLQLEVKGLSLVNRVYPLNKVSIEEVFRTTPVVPKTVLACLLSALAAALGCYLVQLIRPLIRHRADIEKLPLSFLGSIPEVNAIHLEDGNQREMLKFGIDTLETTAFKHIRSRLQHLAEYSGSEQRKVISFFSYGNAEGKSFITRNLAACFAYSGKRVLLVDFDIRRAFVSKVFGLLSKPGLCDYFSGQISLKDAISKDPSTRLDILPAGSKALFSLDSLSNVAVVELFQKLRDQYDIIVVDTAPILVAPESIVLAKETDFAVLIGTSWKTKLEHIQSALEEVRAVRVKAVHLIINKLNDVAASSVKNYYYMTSPGSSSRSSSKGRTQKERVLDN